MSDPARLRELLLGADLRALEQAHARLDAIEEAERALPNRLPEALQADTGDGGARLGVAFGTPVTLALGAAVRENRQTIVDVLFPVIGPAIRKAIAGCGGVQIARAR